MSDTLRAAAQQALEALEQIKEADTAGATPKMVVAARALYEPTIDALRAALAAPEPEPDMRHPKIQALIGSRARKNIEMMLVEQLLEKGPDTELTSMDMEYWNSTHDKLREALLRTAEAEPDEPERRCGGPGCDGNCCQPVAAAVAEPIYQWRTIGCADWYDGHPDHGDGGGGGPYETRALYTAPPPLQPLTDEQIDVMWRVECLRDAVGRDKPRKFARAIERAHGIAPASAPKEQP